MIQERIRNFWGYGNLNGPYWFVGMEEGYSEENETLLDRFSNFVPPNVRYIRPFKIDHGHVYWFEEGAPIQPTWRRLVEMLIYSETGKHPDKEAIRRFQIEHLGRIKSNHALLELMPLPSKSISEKHWLYADSGVVGLSLARNILKHTKMNALKGYEL